MKIYHGHRDDSGTLVTVHDDGERDYVLPVRLDLYNHSPDGFEWGYQGSGPAQLALAILADALKAPSGKRPPSIFDYDTEEQERKDPRMLAVRLHQQFKRRFIAGLDHDGPWTIVEQAVLDFVRGELASDGR